MMSIHVNSSKGTLENILGYQIDLFNNSTIYQRTDAIDTTISIKVYIISMLI